MGFITDAIVDLVAQAALNKADRKWPRWGFIIGFGLPIFLLIGLLWFLIIAG